MPSISRRAAAVCAQGAIGAHAAANTDLPRPRRQRRIRRLLHQYIRHRLLKGRRQIGQQAGVAQVSTPARQAVWSS